MLASADIIEKARRKAGLEAFDAETFREGLDIIVADANDSNDLSESGRIGIEKIFIGLLVNRLRVAQYLRDHPALLDQPVEKPVFTLGAPRTGTTLLCNLLAADPARRSLLRWEISDLVPPAAPGALKTDSRCLRRMKIEEDRPEARSASLKLHYEAADGPAECTILHGQDFKAQSIEALFPAPRYSEWILGCDMRSPYEYHRKVLQILQSTNPGRWNLKMPSHALHIKALLDVFPDAQLIWMHRDVFKAAGSFLSLIEAIQSGFCDKPDRAFVGRTYPRQFAEHLLRPLAERASRGRFYDQHYSDLVRDPITQMRKVYDWLGDPFTPDAEAGMRAWLQENPQGRFGTHRYSLDQYGLSVDDLEPMLAPYLEQFAPEEEGFA
jgi:Sulfotransferase family